MPKIFPWICMFCGNRWVDGLFVTWEHCPECHGEAQHDSVRELRDDDEWYEDSNEEGETL
ncbi:hypothetical protein SAMN06272722_110249 [Paenibacillus sp. RU5A]|nr:hypothetical protein SAMN06272722_110249 [Paenibacillus sp. RU5A]SOC74472.1 hypothetical protein SAMN05880581_110249 [Paenibacillus sp. RU26A]SOC76660.1 hypothetical protein SAMN05880586_110249 [Paenibacillus sp. RU5M]